MILPRKGNLGFRIGVSCPGCGAELELEDDFFALTCRFCGTVLRVIMPDIPPAYVVKKKKQGVEVRFLLDRNLKENDLPLTGSDFSLELVYYPYWKIEGLLLKVRPAESKSELVSDHGSGDGLGLGSLLAEGSVEREQSPRTEDSEPKISLSPYMITIGAGIAMNAIPATIGRRPEYVRLLPYSPEHIDPTVLYMPITFSWEQAVAAALKSVWLKSSLDSSGRGARKTKLYHPTGAIIYFPYYRGRSTVGGTTQYYTIDALTGRLVHYDDKREDLATPSGSGTAPYGTLKVEQNLCPNCGNKLPAVPSWVYLCDDCGRAISLDPKFPTGNGIQFVPSGAGGDDFFPFWVFQFPRETQKANGMIVVPAFRIANFEVIRRLTKRMTAVLPQMPSLIHDAGHRQVRPVSLTSSRALAVAEVIVHCEQMNRPTTDGSLPAPVNLRLIYLPFQHEQYYYVDSVLNAVTFERAAVERQTISA